LTFFLIPPFRQFEVDISTNDVVTEKAPSTAYSLSISRTLGTFGGTYDYGDGPTS
jgi:hypothetical protein